MFCTHWERLSLTYCTGVLCSLFSNSGILLEKYGWLTFLLLIILWQPSVWAWARPTPGSEALRRHHNGEPTLQLQERPPWTGLTTGTPIPVYKPLTPSITSCNGCAATRFGWISTTTRPVSRSTQLKYFCNDPSIYKISFTIFFGGKIPNQLSLSSLVLVCTIEALKTWRFVSVTRCYTGAACFLHTQHVYVRCASWIPGLLSSAILWDSNRQPVDRPSWICCICHRWFYSGI